MSKPISILVPGAWHTPAILSPVINLLATHDYKAYALSLPSVGVSPGISDFGPDVTALQALINIHLTAGEDVIVVLHSYGGMVGSEAVLPSMLKSSRVSESKSGGVVRLVYVSASAVPIGMSIQSHDPQTSSENAGDFAFFDLEAGTVAVNPKYAGTLFYNDIKDPVALAGLIADLRTHSIGTLTSRLTRAAYAYTPATFVICQQDNAVSVEKAEGMIDAARKIWEVAFDKIERCDAGHTPFVSIPEHITKILRRAAGETI